MTELKSAEAEQALSEHLAAVGGGSTEQATAYHATVNDLRRELAGSSDAFMQMHEPYLQAAVARYDAKRAAAPGHEPPPPPRAEMDAQLASLMAYSYAYTLAALLKAAGDWYGEKAARDLANLADNILTNGDDDDLNADVWPAGVPA